MSRHIRWGIIFIMTLLIAGAAASPIWVQMIEPYIETKETVATFTCPENFALEICEALADLNNDNPEAAAAMVASIAAGSVPGPSNEVEQDSIREGIDLAAVSDFTETQIRVGNFTEFEILHGAQGRATIWELIAGGEVSWVLRFDNDFAVTLGPDLRVYLSAHPNPQTTEDMRRGNLQVEVGILKGNEGSQNYPLDEELDVTQFGSVVIFSEALGTIFSTAPLQQPIQ